VHRAESKTRYFGGVCMIAVSCDICDTWETSCRRSHDTVRQRLTHAYCFVLDLSLSSSGWIWLLDTFFAQSDGSSKSSETRKDRRNGVAVQLVSPYCASKWQHFHRHIYGKEDMPRRLCGVGTDVRGSGGAKSGSIERSETAPPSTFQNFASSPFNWERCGRDFNLKRRYERLNRFNLEIYEVGYQKRLTVNRDVVFYWKNN
jgi:hypothetical protein